MLGPLLDKQRAAISSGDQFASNGNLAAASEHYAEAVTYSRRVPEKYFWFMLDDALKKLIDTLEKQDGTQRAKASEQIEALMTERVELLGRHPEDSDLALGLALFDLESFHASQKRLDKAEHTAQRAVEFYKKCAVLGNKREVCDRRMADVEGIIGGALFAAGRFDAAEGWLRRVVARKDENVRPEIMVLSLRAYAALLRQRGEEERASQTEQRASSLVGK